MTRKKSIVIPGAEIAAPPARCIAWYQEECAVFSDTAKRNALLRQLLRKQGGGGNGVLYCHPTRQAAVAIWLGQHPHLGWRLAEDSALAQDVLKLITAQGAVSLNWEKRVFPPGGWRIIS